MVQNERTAQECRGAYQKFLTACQQRDATSAPIFARIIAENILAWIGANQGIEKVKEGNRAFAKRLRDAGHLNDEQCRAVDRIVKPGNDAAHNVNPSTRLNFDLLTRDVSILLSKVSDLDRSLFASMMQLRAPGKERLTPQTKAKWHKIWDERYVSPKESGCLSRGMLYLSILAFIMFCTFLLRAWAVPEKVDIKNLDKVRLYAVRKNQAEVSALAGDDPNIATDLTILPDETIYASHYFERDGSKWLGGKSSSRKSTIWVDIKNLSMRYVEISGVELVERHESGLYRPLNRRTILSVIGRTPSYSIRVSYKNAVPFQSNFALHINGDYIGSICRKTLPFSNGIISCNIEKNLIGRFRINANIDDKILPFGQITVRKAPSDFVYYQDIEKITPTFSCDGELDWTSSIICYDEELSKLDRLLKHYADATPDSSLIEKRQSEEIESIVRSLKFSSDDCEKVLYGRKCLLNLYSSETAKARDIRFPPVPVGLEQFYE